MKHSVTITNGIHWVARIWGSLIVVFILFFLTMEAFGSESTAPGFLNYREIVTFIFFPMSTVIGLVIALKWEGLGGLIATVGIVMLFVLRPDLLVAFIFVAGRSPPGILYLIYWYLRRGDSNQLK